MAAKPKVRLKLLDVFEELNNFVDMNGSNRVLLKTEKDLNHRKEHSGIEKDFLYVILCHKNVC